MREHDDDLLRLFTPLRAVPGATDDEVRRVRRAAEDGPRPGAARPQRRRRRWITAGATAGAVGLATVAAIALVDRSRSGVFVGEAGARDLLRSAADAARDEPMITGWSVRTTTSVIRIPVQGRRCATCRSERGLYEVRFVADEWTGARGEAYSRTRPESKEALENEGLLRATGVLDPPGQLQGAPSSDVHVPPATGARGEPLATLGLPGAISDPEAIPTTPRGIVAWTVRRLRAESRQAADPTFGDPDGTAYLGRVQDRVGQALVEVALSPNIGGVRRAAAFEALAGRRGVVVAPVPKGFASSSRVGVRVPGPVASYDPRTKEYGDRADSISSPERSPLVVFDRDSRRIVALEDGDPSPAPGTRLDDGEGGAVLRVLPGVEAETRYTQPVEVAAPGLDEDGKRTFDLKDATDTDRTGESSP